MAAPNPSLARSKMTSHATFAGATGTREGEVASRHPPDRTPTCRSQEKAQKVENRAAVLLTNTSASFSVVCLTGRLRLRSSGQNAPAVSMSRRRVQSDTPQCAMPGNAVVDIEPARWLNRGVMP